MPRSPDLATFVLVDRLTIASPLAHVQIIHATHRYLWSHYCGGEQRVVRDLHVGDSHSGHTRMWVLAIVCKVLGIDACAALSPAILIFSIARKDLGSLEMRLHCEHI